MYTLITSRSMETPTACSPGSGPVWAEWCNPCSPGLHTCPPQEQSSTPTNPKPVAVAGSSAGWGNQQIQSPSRASVAPWGSPPPPRSPVSQSRGCGRRFMPRQLSMPDSGEKALSVAGNWRVVVSSSVVWRDQTEAGPGVPHAPPALLQQGWEAMAGSWGHKPLTLL